jgi:ribosome-binding factor A
MPKDFSRTERLAQLIQRELALLIQQEIKDPRLGLVTVSEVVISRDLAYAKVYVTIYADEAKIATNLKILNHAAGFLRTMLSRRIIARTIPQLSFIYDKTLIEGNRLARLIDNVINEDDKRKSE